ncbi:MAG: NUDIX domain-containing protein [Candidatus Woesearchaeota archaeon]|jgi:8-oxo-dGTP diphosphatase|nr:NUDIX domain-containing protein [Candidatus Woesearchaeota archaeon]MDP7198521.1 NUDIX domain-containing protein [Candidatus Woesearchaeota archaeon]MDP7466737.1 NUDIX domain-containing protein [Candidatus Woesearchaeota archaeon]MDP7647962.1 NUDIX domain-containing protein [Candidatus Woesearchaeota archaeon]|tara:strand:+ start:522 stop:944 length:423 start_codon:yes stop_codon:yes gene_type:complete
MIGVGFGVLLLKDGKMLLGKRHEDPSKASSALHGEGTWTMPGGKLHFRESFEEGAKREVLEETGIKLTSASVICVNNDVVHDAHFVTIGLVAEDFSGEAVVKEPDEITEWAWFPVDMPPKNLFSASAKVLECYRERKASQ